MAPIPINRVRAFHYGFRCPWCNRALKVVEAKNGNFFYGCVGYPKCRYISYLHSDLKIRPNQSASGAYYLYRYIPEEDYDIAFKWDIYYTKKIIAFENGSISASEFFAKALVLALEVIAKGDTKVGLVAVPSSNRYKVPYMEGCIQKMIEKSEEFSRTPKLVNLSRLLKRAYSVPDSSEGGGANLHEHYESLAINKSISVEGIDRVILLDDIVRNGTVTVACEKRLRDAGIEKVDTIVLGAIYEAPDDIYYIQ